MRTRHVITTIDTHTFGEPTRIITSGLAPLPGSTVLAKQKHFQAKFDGLRLAMVREPRGHPDMFAALLTVPVSPGAAFSVIFMDNAGYLTGCGHAGVINTLHWARELTETTDIAAVIGGFHLTGPVFEPIIAPTIQALGQFAPQVIVPQHCTGWKASHLIAREFPHAFVANSVGTTLVIGA